MKLLVALLAAAACGQSPPTIHLRPLDAREIEAARAQSKGAALAGVHRSLEAGAIRRGQWFKLPSGAPVWRLALRSPAASGLRLHFRDFSVGSGSVTVRSAGARAESGGPYSGRGPTQDGDFWTDVIHAESVIVEFQPATGKKGPLPFRIIAVAHLL